MEIVLRALMIGYTQGRNDLYDEGRVVTKSIQQKIDAYDELMEDRPSNPYERIPKDALDIISRPW